MPDQPSYDDLVVQQIYEQGEARAKGMASQTGRPPDTKDLTDQRELHEWLRSNDKINVQALLDAKVPIEDITRAKHPNRVRLIMTHSPDWSERCKYAEKMAKLAEEYLAADGANSLGQRPYPLPAGPALSELDAMDPVEAPATNGAGY